jgi:hypothetical protein
MKAIKYTLCIAAVVSFAITADAILASYPDQVGTTVLITDISENTDAGQYGAPTMVGNTMLFSPLGVKASSTGGGAVQNDAQIQFKVAATPGNYIESLILNELGDFSFEDDGTGTDATKVDVDANYFLTITEINGNPAELTIPIVPFPTTMTFLPKASGEILLSEEALGPFWQGSLTFDINAAVAAHPDYDASDKATRVSININNILKASSELGTTASIAKKNVINGFTVEIIPEPASVLLLTSAFAGIVIVRRRFVS